MRIGVIRNDLQGPLRLADLEPVSQYNPIIEPEGQECYLDRPATTAVEAILEDDTLGAGATNEGSTLTFPIVVVVSTSDVLRVRTSSAASWSAVTIPAASYATMAALVTAINAVTSVVGVQARSNTAGTKLALESMTRGVDSYVGLDTVLNGSTANTLLGLTAGARTMPSAADFITALSPPGGPLDVSTSAVNAVGASTASAALAKIPTARGTTAAVADLIAPRFIETPVAVDSFLVGMVSEWASSSYNPDPRRNPSLTDGAAVTVLEDDGVTPFAETLPTISDATLDLGDVTIEGTGLGGEAPETRVRFTGDLNKTLEQAVIEHAGGTVTSTEIVIPASLIPGVATTTTSVKVQVRGRMSGSEALA